MDWGNDLFDKYDDLIKHFGNSIEFLDHFSRIIQERVKFENDYAKSVKKMPSKYQLKKKDEYGGPPLSYEEALEQTLVSTKSIGLQHEAIADNLKQNVIEPVAKYMQDMKKRKAHFQNEFKRLERQMTQSSGALDQSFQRYKRAHFDMNRADEAYKAAEENRNLARAEVDRHKSIAEGKKNECDAMKTNYASQLEAANKIRSNYYHNVLPSLLQEMQKEDKKRTEEFARLMQSAVEAESCVMGTMGSCHGDMLKAVQSISWDKDNQKMVENMRSGHQKPGEISFNNLDSLSRGGSVESITPSAAHPGPIGTVRGKKEKKESGGLISIFGGKRKPAKESENFSHLGPEQQKKKLNEKIAEVKSSVSKVYTEVESLRKLKTTFTDKAQCQNIQAQISETEGRYEKLQQELAMWEGYLREATGGESVNGRVSQSANNPPSRPTSVAAGPAPQPTAVPSRQNIHSSRSDDFSDDEFGPPPAAEPAVQQSQQMAFIGGCTAVYDYVNDTGDGLSMSQGDQFYVVAGDSGDGWTLVSSLDSAHQGYVPSGYINIQFY